jgi:hypothetical protein
MPDLGGLSRARSPALGSGGDRINDAAFLTVTLGAWIAENPDGPWQYLGVAATETVQQGQIGYDAKVVDLTGAGGRPSTA